MFNRMALTTALCDETAIYHEVFKPLTPFASEMLVKSRFLTDSTNEQLALILYDTDGANSEYAEALREDIEANLDELGLCDFHLDQRLVIVNAGLEVDSDMPHGLRPVILPEYTEVFPSSILTYSAQDHKFAYGTDNGFPSSSDNGKGSRLLRMPGFNSHLGLRYLNREGKQYLHADFKNFDQVVSNSRFHIQPRRGPETEE